MKIYVEEATILSIFDYKDFEKVALGKVLFGVVKYDEANRFSPKERVVTSKLITSGDLQYITHSGNCYIVDKIPDELDISFAEFVVIKHKLYSPNELLEMRKILKAVDERKLN